MKLMNLLKNRNVIMLLAVALGLVWGDGARWTSWAPLPALALVMTISTLGIDGSSFRSARAMLHPSVAGIVMSYAVHATILLGLGALLVSDRDLWIGIVLGAAVPPAVAVIPFAVFLKGDHQYALMGTVGAYLGALVLQPLILVGLVGAGFVSPWKVLLILFELVIGPLVLSRILIATGLSVRVDRWKGTLSNWGFFIVVYTMVALNRGVFLGRIDLLLPVLAIAFLSTFGIGWLVERVGRALRLSRGRLMSLLLLGTFKNYGLAGGLALYFFNDQTAVPATVTSVVAILYMVWLEAREKWAPRRTPATA